ncbi:MAG: segregation/condensation protein A [Candidatus Moraniibacteriota bacterium]
MEYHIQLEQFEGPLPLLLTLIEREKLDITRLSLAKVADQYLEYLTKEEHISLDNLARFLSIAARLILIKSKALLPTLTFTDEEEDEIGDLEAELRRYKQFKEAAMRLGMLVSEKHTIYTRESSLGSVSIFLPPKNLTREDLANYFQSVLGNLPSMEILEEKRVAEIVTLEEKITLLQESIRDRVQKSFSEIVSLATDRVHVIVSFLALLELVKQRVIHAEQGELFGDIHFRNATEKTTSVN